MLKADANKKFILSLLERGIMALKRYTSLVSFLVGVGLIDNVDLHLITNRAPQPARGEIETNVGSSSPDIPLMSKSCEVIRFIVGDKGFLLLILSKNCSGTLSRSSWGHLVPYNAAFEFGMVYSVSILVLPTVAAHWLNVLHTTERDAVI